MRNVVCMMLCNMFLLNVADIERTFISTSPAQKSKSSRRNAAEHHEVPEVLSCNSRAGSTVSDSSQTTRLKELLSPPSCSNPLNLKPTPPAVPKVRERCSSNTSTPATPISTMDQTEVGTRAGIPPKKRNTHVSVHTASGKTDAYANPPKQRSHKEQASEKASVKDQTHASLRSNSSSDHKRLSRKTQSGSISKMSTSTQREHDKEQLRRRNEAARIIQQVWRR